MRKCALLSSVRPAALSAEARIVRAASRRNHTKVLKEEAPGEAPAKDADDEHDSSGQRTRSVSINCAAVPGRDELVKPGSARQPEAPLPDLENHRAFRRAPVDEGLLLCRRVRRWMGDPRRDSSGGTGELEAWDDLHDAGRREPPVRSTSAPPRGLDGGDVDLLHRHHRLESTLCLIATCRKRVG